MIRAHVDAVVALVPTVSAYVTRPPGDASLPYVVVHPDQGEAYADSMAGASSWRPWTVQTTCVGVTAEQALWAAEQVEAGLLDAVPTVAGRQCTPIRKEASVPLARDEDVQPPVFIARDVWAFVSVPA